MMLLIRVSMSRSGIRWIVSFLELVMMLKFMIVRIEMVVMLRKLMFGVMKVFYYCGLFWCWKYMMIEIVVSFCRISMLRVLKLSIVGMSVMMGLVLVRVNRIVMIVVKLVCMVFVSCGVLFVWVWVRVWGRIFV